MLKEICERLDLLVQQAFPRSHPPAADGIGGPRPGSGVVCQFDCGTGPRAGGSTPSTATEHRKYCSSPTNSQKAQRSKPRNSRSRFSAPSSSATTRSPETFAKRAETSESRRSNPRSSWSHGLDACQLGAPVLSETLVSSGACVARNCLNVGKLSALWSSGFHSVAVNLALSELRSLASMRVRL
jgi:hypothetical protein